MSCGPLLDDCILASIGDAVALTLIDTFKIQAFSMASDGSGGVTQTWTDQSTGIAGSFAKSFLRSIEANVGASQQAERRWTVLLESGTVVEEANRIVQTHKNGTAITPRTFKVEAVYAEDTYAALVYCECIELPNIT